jgi:2-iminobutanoate/2-iminopropanoate deaminase
MRKLLILAAALVPSLAMAQRTQIIPTGQRASATLSPGIKAGDLIFTSGQQGFSRANPDSTVQGQTKKSLENVKAVVEAAGSNMDHVVKCTVFLVDVKDFSGMNSAYTAAFPKEPPARSTVVVAALVSPGAKVEIECVATMPK